MSFALAGIFIPVFGVFFLMILPMTLFVLYTVNDKIKTTAAFAIPLLLIYLMALLANIQIPIVALLAMGLSGILMSVMVQRQSSILKVVLFPALLLIVSIAVFFIWGAWQQGIHPWQSVEKYIAMAIKENVRILSQLPLEKNDIQYLIDNEASIIQSFTHIFPAIATLTALFIVWSNMLIGKIFLEKYGIFPTSLTGLSEWKAPPHLVWFFLASSALNFVPQAEIIFFSLNIFLFLCIIYFLQGLAILSFFFKSKNIPPFLRYLFYFFIAIQQILMIPIATAGFLDIWIDFRKWFRQEKPDN
jgi:uncharacterized protein YybS (DUF2232 family)